MTDQAPDTADQAPDTAVTLGHIRRLCEAYRDEPPPIFRGPGLSEHGVGYVAGARDIARAVLTYLAGEQADDDGDDQAPAVEPDTYAMQPGVIIASPLTRDGDHVQLWPDAGGAPAGTVERLGWVPDDPTQYVYLLVRVAGWSTPVVAVTTAGCLRPALRYADRSVQRDEQFARVLFDLDRCDHGRHDGDTCADCPGGRSAGNPRMPAGARIGTTYTGKPIVMPERPVRIHPAAWCPDGVR